MKNFVYNTPTKVFFGAGEEKKIGEIVASYGFKKVLLHYGKSSIKKIGLYDTVVTSLKANGIEYLELGGVEPNPKLSLVHQGIKIVKENNIDFILAVGGGSVIDSAKAISTGAKVDFDVWEFNAKTKVCHDHLPVGVILTLSASGSAMSNSCVITNDSNQLKRGYNSEENRPLFAVLNPELTYSVSKYQTACGVVDIMMHTLERFLSKDEGFDLSNSIAIALLKNVKKYGLIAYNDPTNYEARANIMWAESLSHNGLTGSGNDFAFTIHPLEHEVSGMFDNVSHAAGLSALFCGYSKYILSHSLDKYVQLGIELFDIDNSLPKETIANMCIDEFEKFFKELNMPTTLGDLNVLPDSFSSMANKLTNNGTTVLHSVVDIDCQAAIDIYNMCK